MLENKTNKSRIASRSVWTDLLIASGLILLGVLLRIACGDLPNVAPVAAVGLFAGFCLSRKTIAVLVPLVIMVISNQWFGGYHWLVMLSVYACYMVMPFAGVWIRQLSNSQSNSWKSAIMSRMTTYGFALAGAVVFFLVTNLAVWASDPGQSLWQTYAIAIPFFRYTLCGDLFFVFSIFACYDFGMIASAKLRKLEVAV